MRCAGRKYMRSAKRWVFILAVAAMAAMPNISTARADDAQAKTLFKAMSDYLAAQQAISFAIDSTLEVVTDQDQKLGLASSGTLTLKRPDKLHATRTGGFANVEMVFDGKTLTVLGKNANMFAKAEEPGTIDQLVDVLRDKYKRPVPAADLLMADPYKELMPLVVEAKDLGSGVIRGVECDHLAFRTEEVDWQIWIAQGDRPYPCRYVITSTKVKGSPQYTVEVRDWKTGDEVASDDFSLEVPQGAKELKPGDVPDFDELPGYIHEKRSTMTMFKRIGVILLVAIGGASCLELGEQLSIPGMYGLVSSAEAVVGRPLTPVSVAGVARRTARRCAAGVTC